MNKKWANWNLLQTADGKQLHIKLKLVQTISKSVPPKEKVHNGNNTQFPNLFYTKNKASVKKKLVYLKSRVTESKGELEKNSRSTSSLAKWPQQLGSGQAKAGNHDLHHFSHRSGSNSSTWAMSRCFSGQSADPRQSSQDVNQHSRMGCGYTMQYFTQLCHNVCPKLTWKELLIYFKGQVGSGGRENDLPSAGWHSQIAPRDGRS